MFPSALLFGAAAFSAASLAHAAPLPSLLPTVDSRGLLGGLGSSGGGILGGGDGLLGGAGVLGGYQGRPDDSYSAASYNNDYPSRAILPGSGLLADVGIEDGKPIPVVGRGLLGGAGGGLLGGGGPGLLGGGILGSSRPDGYYGYPSHGAGEGLLPGSGLLADVGIQDGNPIPVVGKRELLGGLLGGGDGLLGAGVLGQAQSQGVPHAGLLGPGLVGLGNGHSIVRKGGLLGGGLLGGGNGLTDGLLSGDGLLGGGLLSTSNYPHSLGPRTPGLPLLGSHNGRLTSLGGNHDLLSNGNGLLGIGEPQGLANTGLLAGGVSRIPTSPAYQWTAPQGWVMPAWYEFGYYHPTTGAWTYDPVSVLAYLQGIGYIAIDTSSGFAPQPLFPTGWDHPVRAVDLTRSAQYGYWNSDQVFITLDVEVTNLLGSCGWYRGYY